MTTPIQQFFAHIQRSLNAKSHQGSQSLPFSVLDRKRVDNPLFPPPVTPVPLPVRGGDTPLVAPPLPAQGDPLFPSLGTPTPLPARGDPLFQPPTTPTPPLPVRGGDPLLVPLPLAVDSEGASAPKRKRTNVPTLIERRLKTEQLQ